MELRIAGIAIGKYDSGWDELFAPLRDTIMSFKNFLLVTDGDTSIFSGVKCLNVILQQHCLWKDGVKKKSAARMFARWCQESFLGYMMEHFAIELLVEHGTETFHGTEKVVNPEWRDLEKQRTSVTGKLRHRRARFAELSMNPEEDDDVKRHLKWENSKAALLEDMRQYESRLEEVKTHAKETPRHITWSELNCRRGGSSINWRHRENGWPRL